MRWYPVYKTKKLSITHPKTLKFSTIFVDACYRYRYIHAYIYVHICVFWSIEFKYIHIYVAVAYLSWLLLIMTIIICFFLFPYTMCWMHVSNSNVCIQIAMCLHYLVFYYNLYYSSSAFSNCKHSQRSDSGAITITEV